MKKLTLFALILLISLPAAAQVREKKVTPDDFDGLLNQARKAFHAEEYSHSIDFLKKATSLAAGQTFQAVIDAMPDAPPGFTKVPVDKADLSNPLAGAMAGSVGHIIEQRYREDNGKGSFEITATANSPMVGMLEGIFRMAGLNPDMEVVTYGEHKAAFESKNNGNRLEIQLPLYSKHLINGKGLNVSEKLFFGMFSQETVDALAAALGR